MTTRVFSDSFGWIDVDVIPSTTFTGRSAIYSFVGDIHQRENEWHRAAVGQGDLLTQEDVKGKANADVPFQGNRGGPVRAVASSDAKAAGAVGCVPPMGGDSGRIPRNRP